MTTIISDFPPKYYKSNGNSYCSIKNLKSGMVSSAAKPAVKFLNMKLPVIRQKHHDSFELNLGNCTIKTPRRCEKGGYVLLVQKSGIRLRGYDYSGFVAGIELLNDLYCQYGERIPECTVADAPELLLRGYHLDLKKGYGKFRNLTDLIHRLRKLRFNTLLIEYENRIRYDIAPEIAATDALSHQQIRTLVTLAEDSGIQVIPLLQSLGHLQYLLPTATMKHLRESDKDFSQWCPSNPASLRFFKAVAKEIIALHPNSTYFHIGGDEARLLGHCPKCAKVVAKSSREYLYFNFISKVCNFIKDQNKTPVLWDDMLTRNKRPELMSKLPAGTTLMYWVYRPEALDETILIFKGGRISKQWPEMIRTPRDFASAPPYFSDFIEDLDREDLKYCRRIAGTDDFPVHLKSLPYMDQIKKAGMNVIGCGAVRYSAADFYNNGYSNLCLWSRAAVKNRLPGVIMSSWAATNIFNTPIRPPSVFDHLIHYSGMMLWNPGLKENELEKSYDRHLGIPGFTHMLRLLDCTLPDISSDWSKYIVEALERMRTAAPPESLKLFDKYHAVVKLEFFRREQIAYRRHSFRNLWSSNMQRQVHYNMLENRLKLTEELTEELVRNFKDEYPKNELRHWIDGWLKSEILTLKCIKKELRSLMNKG